MLKSQVLNMVTVFFHYNRSRFFLRRAVMSQFFILFWATEANVGQNHLQAVCETI